MAYSKGRAEVRRYMDDTARNITKLMRGAGRVGGNVIADEARARCVSDRVREEIRVRVEVDGTRIITRILVPGPITGVAGLARWLEYGTSPHYITVDDSQRAGMDVQKINDLAKAGSLVIDGKFVGRTVHHPGATRRAFLRESLDIKLNDAVAAAQGYIKARVKPSGIVETSEEPDA